MASGNIVLGPGDTIGEGDSNIIYQALSSDLAHTAFESLQTEVAWQTMHHRSGEVPRLVSVQGDVDSSDDTVPIYRHPADESPPLLPFTTTVQRVREEVQELLSQPFNHVLIQLYRHGEDNISEHSDKVRHLNFSSSLYWLKSKSSRPSTLLEVLALSTSV